MPSTRRVKVLAALAAKSTGTRSSEDFYSKTVAAMNRKDSPLKSGSIRHEDDQAATEGNEPPPILSPNNQEHEAILVAPDDKSQKPVKDGEKTVAGRRKLKGGEKWDMATGKEAPKAKDSSEDKEDGKEETSEEHEVEVELNAILKKGPIIIFSKSYCAFSRKAKDILLEKYTIVPTPYVVELDEHPLGKGLQAALAKSTGRKTVPNVLINGKSIGGGDDVEKLDVDGALVSKVKSMGGKRIMEAKLRPPA
ncbi:MAG: hypothetical protein Q9167_007128 [Letrouitia subvulpina]